MDFSSGKPATKKNFLDRIWEAINNLVPNPTLIDPLPTRPSPTPTPIPGVTPVNPPALAFNGGQPTTTPFKFAPFGQKDYSKYKPQIAKMYSELGSPLGEQIDTFMTASNKYGVDPRILAFIGQIESSGGKNYPVDSNNPFGYLVNGGGVQGLKNAGFTSVPHAIDALTGRFSRQPFEGYKKFAKEPTIENLQGAYNANPAEKQRYLETFDKIKKYYQ
jgi:hypothetical protein